MCRDVTAEDVPHRDEALGGRCRARPYPDVAVVGVVDVRVGWGGLRPLCTCAARRKRHGQQREGEQGEWLAGAESRGVGVIRHRFTYPSSG